MSLRWRVAARPSRTAALTTSIDDLPQQPSTVLTPPCRPPNGLASASPTLVQVTRTSSLKQQIAPTNTERNISAPVATIVIKARSDGFASLSICAVSPEVRFARIFRTSADCATRLACSRSMCASPSLV